MNASHNRVSRAYYATWIPRKYGGTLEQRLVSLRENETRDRAQIEALRWAALRRLLIHAEQHVPYFRNVFRQSGLRADEITDAVSFSRIPLLTKVDIQENLESLVADNFERNALIRSATGGSTGRPVPYYHDQEYEQQHSAMLLRNQAWTGWQFGDPIVKLWGSAFDVQLQTQLKERVVNFFRNETIFPAYRMSQENQSRWLEMLHRIQPMMIMGYTNALVKLAEFSQENHIPVNDAGIKAVVCSADTLFPWHRQLIEKTFGCRVYNRYGSRELGTIAQECEHGRMHINEDWLYVEITDDLGRPLPPGETGQVVLTGFFNQGMPFIRYAIQDVAAFEPGDGPCPCGRSFHALERLEGRIQDLIVMPEGGYIPGVFFGQVFKEFDIRRYQVVQPEIEKLEIYLVPGENFDEASLEKVRQTISQYTPGSQKNYHLVDDIPLNVSGKLRTIISHVARADVLREPQRQAPGEDNRRGG